MRVGASALAGVRGDFSRRLQLSAARGVITNEIRMQHCLWHVLIPDFRRRAICVDLHEHSRLCLLCLSGHPNMGGPMRMNPPRGMAMGPQVRLR